MSERITNLLAAIFWTVLLLGILAGVLGAAFVL